ncbi:hypothetical protein CPB84DRAFT_1957089 [Gymnopilus junonius]|uniref:Aminoglycoside phosphotransferase domain-containing protein n=1 Tax=Gymnopilus junonius TaxID=109634 RepID=A0A9P5P0C1_GYMJU|nr:hypothetical protein CPB84DRAFT_1957089 [Gymnopilus junonius]
MRNAAIECLLDSITDTPGGNLKSALYCFLCCLADVIGNILSFLSSTSGRQQDIFPSDLTELTDEELIARLARVPRLESQSDCRDANPVLHISPLLIAKEAQEYCSSLPDSPEANALDLVFKDTTIPLRSVNPPPGAPPGPVTKSGPRECECPPIFGPVRSARGPFTAYSDLAAYFNSRWKITMDTSGVPEDHPKRKEQFDDSQPLVLTHLDLSPSNIILGNDGRLWLIDWAWAGFYPPWFEYVAMKDQSRNENVVGFEDMSWEAFVPFICGPYFKQEAWLREVAQILCYVK